MLNDSFPGQYYPPSTIVSFPTKKGKMTGKVQKLNQKTARVAVGSNESIWKVPYGIMEIEDQPVRPEITLKEISEFAYKKLHDYELYDWIFGFDLAQNRGGVCNYTRKRITLSVTFCSVATKEVIFDTVLHEIAHALAGYKEAHGPKWKNIARSIGCKATVCHSIDHGLDRWKGYCPCGETWKRKRLQKRIRSARCPKCKDKITWEAII